MDVGRRKWAGSDQLLIDVPILDIREGEKRERERETWDTSLEFISAFSYSSLIYSTSIC